MNPKLTARQQQVFDLLSKGLSLRAAARRLGICDSSMDAHRVELLRKFGLQTTEELRTLAMAVAPPAASTGSASRRLRHQRHLLPNVLLKAGSPLGAASRAAFDGRSLRDAADYVCDCDTEPGPIPDDPRSSLLHGTGTVGSKQAFLAALAHEGGCMDLQLVVACCEMRLPEATGRSLDSLKHVPSSLPLAVCWLTYQGRRLQISDVGADAEQPFDPISEVTVDPHQLAAERVRLYEQFAADWCNALELNAAAFARLRARQLRAARGTVLYEDLLGHSIAEDFRPAVNG